MKRIGRVGLAFALTACCVQAGKIVIFDDNGMWGNGGVDAERYADNVATFFHGSSGGSFLAYAGYSMAIPLFSSGSGNSVTLDTVQPGLTRLGMFDGVFLGYRDISDTGFQAVLRDYVNGGGNVHIVAGDYGDPGWHEFLNPFGLEFSSSLDGLSGSYSVTATDPAHPIMDGVSALYFDNGNPTLVYGSGSISRVVATVGGSPVVAVYDSAVLSPEPDTSLLLTGSLAGLLLYRKTKSTCSPSETV